MNVRTVITLLLFLPAACTGQTSKNQHRIVGGCEADTIRLGIAMERRAVPEGKTARIEILSLEFAGEELYRKASAELTSLLDSLGVTTYSRTDLIHIKKGPCWPRYRIRFRIDTKDDKQIEEICSALLETPLGGHLPSTERPEGYGIFFVTFGRGDKDLWTLWYPGE
jgi:hypothetical protein